ncbi:receptor-like kinase TMK4 [Tanacetum coccineum]
MLVPDLNELSQLKTLDVQRILISEEIPVLSSLRNLRTVLLDNNNFTSLPSLTILKVFTVSENINLAQWGLPDYLTDVTNLQTFQASNANIVGIIVPDIFSSLTNLLNLRLSYSNLTGELRLNNQKQGLSGTLDVVSLTLQLTGLVPALLVSLPKLANITLHNNKLQGPVPEFKSAVKVDKYQNKNSFCLSKPGLCDPQGDTPVFPPTVKFLFGGNPNIGTDVSNTSGSGSGSGSVMLCYAKKRNQKLVKIKDPESGKEIVKASVIGSSSNAHTCTELMSRGSSDHAAMHVFEGGNVDISIYDLRQVTDNFSEENILGRGEFRVVYKGELHDGTKIAVKRMEAGVMGTKGLKEFQAEILVLTKVRHRHLLALLGYCVNDLKPYNILLGDDMRAKVADFGLVKNAPDKDGKFSTKLSNTDDEERLESIYKVAELAGHCTARDPYQRPDMGHEVYVLGPLVEQWKPSRPEEDDGDPGINLNTSLPLLVRRWERDEGTSTMYDYSFSQPQSGNCGCISVRGWSVAKTGCYRSLFRD